MGMPALVCLWVGQSVVTQVRMVVTLGDRIDGRGLQEPPEVLVYSVLDVGGGYIHLYRFTKPHP